MIQAAGCSCRATLIIASSCLFSFMILVRSSSESAENKSATTATSCCMSPHIFSVTESSRVCVVISRNSPPRVSYDSNLLAYDNKLYCSMLSDIEAICEPKSLHWHLPMLRRDLHSWKDTSMDQRIEYI